VSRDYEMSVEITGYDSAKTDAIRDAAAEKWAFADWYDLDDTLT
jgi:hypothetical protein